MSLPLKCVTLNEAYCLRTELPALHEYQLTAVHIFFSTLYYIADRTAQQLERVAGYVDDCKSKMEKVNGSIVNISRNIGQNAYKLRKWMAIFLLAPACIKGLFKRSYLGVRSISWCQVVNWTSKKITPR
jgi:hypothetical protein